MAKGIREIKRQIKSKQNTRQITKAMEMVAASRLRRAQEAAEASRPYAEKMKEVIASIAAGTKNSKQPLLQAREVKKTGYIVVTSDRGLAGGYNANVLRKVTADIRSRHKSTSEYAILVFGRKGRDYFKRREMPVIEEVTGLPDSPQFSDIKSIAEAAVKGFEEERYDELYLIYNEFINAISQQPVEKKLLPLSDLAEGGTAFNYEYEPDVDTVLNTILPQYAETLIYSAVLEGKASEFGARMTAMGNATKNATEIINGLTLAYNRARQAAITQEIAEIVGGANALS